ncbi:WXG100 family type VII secretion target [Microbacterium luticocti]|uniref:WXG100 family type VII secretion target n=1 Tax=Microbacterium luticocti TaxID=451764 RepID=UPI0003FAE40C|nr:WXG100 family type VII secretion target [Microbacterium luticocti]
MSFSVNPEQVVTLAGNIRNGAQGIGQELEQLDRAVATLRGSWDGAAQEAYGEAQRKWRQSLSSMNQLLEQIAHKTEEMSHGYVHSDKKSSGRFLQ